MRVGIIGYSGQPFDHKLGCELIQDVFDLISVSEEIEIISGLTRVGIPAIAYEEAVKRGWKTVGVACAKAFDYECFPVDEVVIVGNDWGDESQTFLDRVDMVVRIGGGKQAYEETRLARLRGKEVLEFELAALTAS